MVGGISGPGVRASVVIVVGVVRTLQAARLIAPISGRVARALPGRAAFYLALAAGYGPAPAIRPDRPGVGADRLLSPCSQKYATRLGWKGQAAPAPWPRLSTPPTADFLRVLLGLGRGARHRPVRENRLEADRGRLKGQAAADVGLTRLRSAMDREAVHRGDAVPGGDVVPAGDISGPLLGRPRHTSAVPTRIGSWSTSRHRRPGLCIRTGQLLQRYRELLPTELADSDSSVCRSPAWAARPL